jgi:PAS domain S-box-containing protein
MKKTDSDEKPKSNNKDKIIPEKNPVYTEKEYQAKIAKLQDRIAELERTIRDTLKEEDLVNKMQERFRLLASYTPAVLYICQPLPPYATTYITDNIQLLLDYEPKEFIVNPFFWSEHIHPEDAHRVLGNFPQVFDRKRHSNEYRFRHHDGSYRWIHDEMQLVFDSYDNPTAVYGFRMDITERKQIEDEIKRLNIDLEYRVQERTKQLETANTELQTQIAINAQKTGKIRLLSDAIQSVDDLVSITDLDHNYIYVNRAFENIYGFTNEELAGKSIEMMWEYFDPRHEERNVPLETIKNGGWEGERTNKRKDGSIFQIWLKTSVVYDENNQPIALAGVARDITDRKLAEKKLQDSESRYRRAITLANAVPYYLEGKLNAYGFLGEKIVSLTGYSNQELTPTIWKSLVQEVILRGELAGKSIEQAKQIALSGEIREWQSDCRIKTRNGETKWIAETYIQIRDEQGIPYNALGILQDITDRKMVEKKLQESENRYHRAITLANAVPFQLDLLTKTYRYIGEGIQSLTGYAQEEFTLSLWKNLIQEVTFRGKLAGYTMDQAKQQIHSGELREWETDVRIKTRTGETRWLAETFVTIVNQEGKPTNAVGILQDVTDRKTKSNENK